MGNDLTLTADRLLASNPTEAAKQGIAPKGLYTIGDVFAEVKFENENITWYDNLESDTPLDNVRTTESIASREQLSDRLNTSSTKKQNVKSENENNDEIRFSDFSACFCHKPAKNQKTAQKLLEYLKNRFLAVPFKKALFPIRVGKHRLLRTLGN